MSTLVKPIALKRDAHGLRRRRPGGGTGVLIVAGTGVLAWTGGLQALAVGYGLALLVVICLIAVAVPVIVVWSFIEEARSDAKGVTGWQ